MLTQEDWLAIEKQKKESKRVKDSASMFLLNKNTFCMESSWYRCSIDGVTQRKSAISVKSDVIYASSKNSRAGEVSIKSEVNNEHKHGQKHK